MIEFTMPALGADMDEGALNEWLVKPGDTVTRGQIVAVVETTKAAVEIECWHDGVVGELLVPIGQTVAVGTPLATILEPGEKAEPRTAAPVAATEAPQHEAAADQPPAILHPAAEPAPVGHRLWVSPVARRTAASLGVDLRGLTGTGPQGAITLHDVEHAAATAHHEKPKPAPPKPAVSAEPKSAAQKARERGAAMRASIAAAMSRSKREIPHYYLADEIILDTALGWLTEQNAGVPITERMLPAVLQLKAVALAAQKFKEFNGFWTDDGFEPSSQVHVGVAISLRGGGLVAPAIHDVNEKKLDELMRDLTDLVGRARAGSLRSSEMSDPTITLTNLGDKGVDSVFGVIYPPQVAIVGVGKVVTRPWVIDGAIGPRSIVTLTLSGDHRVSDGHAGANFLAEI
ncbi:MAG TPA: dihydrolipoamide acetyltransferase family protein, partial [Mycobacterium sp.]|nr:dihydrolipoamide acetyltransferase family protein [Mycobacterium sp.]